MIDPSLTTREAADAIVYGWGPILSGILEQTRDRADQKEVLEGVVVRLITHLRHNKELHLTRNHRHYGATAI